MKYMCTYNGCIKRASFGNKGEHAQFCRIHVISGMIDVVNKRCKQDGCDKLNPVFGIKGHSGEFCGKHRHPNMVNVTSKQCEQVECNKLPIFGIPGDSAKFCSSHMTFGMVDVKNKTCEHDGCYTRASYGVKWNKGRYCAIHKIEGMVDLYNKSCEYAGCTMLNPTYDIKGGKGRFCGIHKIADMVNVKSKHCEHDGCDKVNPNFDNIGGKGRFCKTHMKADMIDVKSHRCEYTGCEKIKPIFDIKGGKGRYCSIHKTTVMVDVRHKVCETDGCTTRSYYGKPGLKVSKCFKHREAGMIRKPNTKCLHCKELAIWGTNWIPRHCEKHKTEDDENLIERKCMSCSLLYILDKNDICENCNPLSWKTARLAKQNALMTYLDSRGLRGNSTDSIIDGGICGKERPDRVYDFVDKIVILECDEHQHRERPCLCEQTRMINIGNSFGGIPVYFIRWNPDEYNPENTNKHPEILSKRYKLCGDVINDIKNNRISLPFGLVSAIYLYYDGWASFADEQWKTLT